MEDVYWTEAYSSNPALYGNDVIASDKRVWQWSFAYAMGETEAEPDTQSLKRARTLGPSSHQSCQIEDDDVCKDAERTKDQISICLINKIVTGRCL